MGYVVVALSGVPAEHEKRFLKHWEYGLQGSFNSLGIPARIEPGLWIEMGGTFISRLVRLRGSAQFCYSMSYHGQEMAVAFFAKEKSIPKTRLIEERECMRWAGDLSTFEPVNFSLFIFERKQNIISTIRHGRVLQPEQENACSTIKSTRFY